ncbi:9557_t:CDS:2, partial [Acaulospora colombiana]
RTIKPPIGSMTGGGSSSVNGTLTKRVDPEIVSVVLEEHLNLRAMLLVHVAVEEEEELDAERGCDSHQSGDKDFVGLWVTGAVLDDGANRFYTHDEIDSAHPVQAMVRLQ